MKKELAIIVGIFFINITMVTYWQFKYHTNGVLPPILKWTGATLGWYIGFTAGQLLITFIVPLLLVLILWCLKWLVVRKWENLVTPLLMVGIFSLILLYVMHIGIKHEQTTNQVYNTTEENEDLLFRNKEYKFRFKYPRGWHVKNGDGQNVKAKVVSKSGANCNVTVYKKPIMENLSNDIVMASISVDDLVKSMSGKFPDIKFFDSGKTKVDNRDAIYGVYSNGYSAGNVNVEARGLVVQTFESGAMYYINCVAEPMLFSENIDKFNRIVQTFVFENW